MHPYAVISRIHIHILIYGLAERFGITDLSRQPFVELMAKQNPDTEVWNIYRFCAESRFQQFVGKRIVDKSGIDTDVRVGKQGGILRSRILGINRHTIQCKQGK